MGGFLFTKRSRLAIGIIVVIAIGVLFSNPILRSSDVPPSASATGRTSTFSGDNGIWSDAAHMMQGRIYGTGLRLPDGRVLIIGGFNTPSSQEAELYDPTSNTWTQTTPNSRRVLPAVVLLPSGKVLVAGGYCECTGSGYTNTAELFDPATNSWTMTGSMNDIHQADAAVLLPNGKVLIAGGASLPFAPSTSAELYDPSTGQWSYTGSLNVPRRYYFMTLLPTGKALIVGGGSAADGSPTNTTELYDPSTGTWTLTGNLYYGAREQNSGTVLPNGKVFIVGGDNGPSLLSTTEFYDPSTGQWAPGPNTQTPYYAPEWSDSLLPLNNGKYIIVGSASASTSSEIYDPSTNTWADHQTLLHYQYGGFAAKLADGRILYAGGTSPSDPTQGVYTEIYDSAISITTDQSQYTGTQPIQVTITNSLSQPIYAFDTKTNCSIVDLQLQVNSVWQRSSQAPCPLGRAARPITIGAGATYTATIHATTRAGMSSAFTPGSYRLALRYGLSPTTIDTTIYSAVITVV